jgi:hypothetical protein
VARWAKKMRAMRAVLDRKEYAEFVEDVEKELDHPDGTDGMR